MRKELQFPSKKNLETYWKKRYDTNFYTKKLNRLNDKIYHNIKKNIGATYKLQDEILTNLFHYQSDCTMSTMFLRIKLLNEFYSTNIPDVCIYSLAKAISNKKIDNITLHSLIMKPKNNADKCLAVHAIACMLKDIFNTGSNNDNSKKIDNYIYSFATKYCHFCNPKEFSIYDKYVAKLLSRYILENECFKDMIENNKDLKTYKEESCDIKKLNLSNIGIILRNYTIFIELIDEFIAQCNLKESKTSVRKEIDNFLWLKGMEEYQNTNKG